MRRLNEREAARYPEAAGDRVKARRLAANTRTRLIRLAQKTRLQLETRSDRNSLEEIAREARDLLPRVLRMARGRRPLWLRAYREELPGILPSVVAGDPEALRFVAWFASASLRLLQLKGRDTPIHTPPSGGKVRQESNQGSADAGRMPGNIQIVDPGKPVPRGATRRGKRNMRTNANRRWRKNGKRGVSPIIATILLVAITVVLAAVLYILISGLTKGPGSTPLGTAYAWGSPSNITASSGTAPAGCGATGPSCYSIEVASASGITTSDLNFGLRTASGAAASFLTTPATTISLVGLSGTVLATYTIATNSWSSGSQSVAAGDTIVVYHAGGGYLGDSLVAVGVGSFSGSVAASVFA